MRAHVYVKARNIFRLYKDKIFLQGARVCDNGEDTICYVYRVLSLLYSPSLVIQRPRIYNVCDREREGDRERETERVNEWDNKELEIKQ